MAYHCSSKKLKAILETGQGNLRWALQHTERAWKEDNANLTLEGRAWRYRGDAMDRALDAQERVEKALADVRDALRDYWGDNS